MSEISAPTVPKHVAIIMDGNGRWAQQRHLPRTAGHAKGASGVKALVERSAKLGIKCLTLFAFSTENWSRPEEEVSTLMALFVRYLEQEMKALAEAGVRLKVIGDVDGFSAQLRQRIKAAEEFTQNNQTINLCVAANYGGRWDLMQAANKWRTDWSSQGDACVSEEIFASYLSTAGLVDVDLLIRTGGERRISNFMLWQVAYAELYFTDVLWPDFGQRELDEALGWFSKRMRRFGKTSEQV